LSRLRAGASSAFLKRGARLPPHDGHAVGTRCMSGPIIGSEGQGGPTPGSLYPSTRIASIGCTLAARIAGTMHAKRPVKTVAAEIATTYRSFNRRVGLGSTVGCGCTRGKAGRWWGEAENVPAELGASGWGCSWEPDGWDDGRWESEPE